MTEFVGLDEIEIVNLKEEIPECKTSRTRSYSQADSVPIRLGNFRVHDGKPSKAAGSLDG